MSVEISLILSGNSLVASLCATFSAIRRGSRAENRQDAGEMATVIVKLEGIEKGIDEIKTESRSMKTEVKELRDRVITAEQRLRSAWGVIEELKSRKESTGC